MNAAPAATTTTLGSAADIVSIVDEAMGLASSIAFVVCWATSVTVYIPTHKTPPQLMFIATKT